MANFIDAGELEINVFPTLIIGSGMGISGVGRMIHVGTGLDPVLRINKGR